MARSPEVGEAEQISFELERFELTAEDRLELGRRAMTWVRRLTAVIVLLAAIAVVLAIVLSTR